MFQPEGSQQYYQNQPKPYYPPQQQYPGYNMSPYQTSINPQNTMQLNQVDNQKNLQNQMGIINPNNPMKQPQMLQQMQPPFQMIPPQYQNNQINLQK